MLNGKVVVEASLVGVFFNGIVFDMWELGRQLGRVRFMYADLVGFGNESSYVGLVI